MNLRCAFCQNPYALSRNEILYALQKMESENLSHYDAHCPRCRRVTQIPRQRLEMAFPNWREAVTEAANAPAPAAPMPAPVEKPQTQPAPTPVNETKTSGKRSRPPKKANEVKPAAKKVTAAKPVVKKATKTKPAAKKTTKTKPAASKKSTSTKGKKK